MRYQTKFAIYDGRKLCRTCKERLPVASFTVNKRTASGLDYNCKDCKRSKARESYRARPAPTKSHLRAVYGITQSDYDDMYSAQGGKCSICAQPYDSLMVDHCHETGAVRGLLCSSCNIGLGWFKDNVTSLANAIKYLSD